MRTEEHLGNDRSTIIRPRPTKASGVALIITGIIFLFFSALPLGAAGGDAQPFATIFGIVWILICLSFVVYGIYILTTKKPTYGIVFDVVEDEKEVHSEKPNDFEMRLRKLDRLKKDGLITEEEYKSKRAEVMQERW